LIDCWQNFGRLCDPQRERTVIDARTIANLAESLGGISPDRIRRTPIPGTATLDDVWKIANREDRLCELIDGVLVEKAHGFPEAVLTSFLVAELFGHSRRYNLGVVLGPAGTIELLPGRIRYPSIAFTAWDHLPNRELPREDIPRIVPNLAVEIVRAANTPGEMALKRRDYFTAGVEIVWEVDPDTRTVNVYTSETDFSTLAIGDTLDGAPVLPGFTLPVATLFAELDRHG
jgi:Uma2 family endonuclease